jgi:hypothetical protein
MSALALSSSQQSDSVAILGNIFPAMFFRLVKREIRDYAVNLLLIAEPPPWQRKDLFAFRAFPTKGCVTDFARDD